MQRNDDKPPGLMQSANTGMAALVTIAQIWTRPLQLLTTRPGTAGRRYFNGLHCGLGLLLFPLVCSVLAQSMELPQHQSGWAGVMVFWFVLLFAQAAHRVRGGWLRKTGYSVHSLYWGKSWIPLIFSSDEAKAKFRRDGVLMMAWGCGIGVLTASAPVLMYGFIGMLLSILPMAYADMQDDARIEAAEDAEHDAMWLASELKRRRGNRWN
jgi:hypothetical protein